jgi:hypothetical protein
MSRTGNALLSVACLLLVSSTAWSAEVVQSIRWQELGASNALKPGLTISTPAGAIEPALRVVHAGLAPATFPLVTIDRPGVTAARYALRGRVRYERVASGSYLEMWNHLPEGVFFSRSLDRSGPMSSFEGSSEWRAFVLPFNREGGSPPEKLVFNLVMTGPGIVEMGPVELIQFAAGENPLADSTAWWSDRHAGIIGSVAGSTLGLLSAVVGWLASTARARGFVLRTLKGIAWLGVGALVAGASAVVLGQPYGVYYPLLLFGAISAALGFSLPRSLHRRYEELELRRMQAIDA